MNTEEQPSGFVRAGRIVVVAAVWCACLAACGGGGVELYAEDLEGLLQEAVDEGLPGVIVLVDAPGDADDFLGAAGLADEGAGSAMTPDTRFRIASNTKSFVGLAGAQLHVAGVLDLDAPVSGYVDAGIVERIENADTVTVRTMLTHQSGIYDYLESDGFWDTVDDDPSQTWTAEEALVFAYDERAYFAPGDGFEYSNSNYLLAGLAIDAATGAHHAEAIRAGILDPLGMGATYYEHVEAASGSLAHGYMEVGGGVDDTFAYDSGYGMADGGLVSTAGDLGTYIGAVGRGDDRLGADAVAEVFAVVARPEDTEEYGLGLSRFSGEHGTLIGHGGNVPGYNSEMFYHPGTDTVVVVLANGSDGGMDEVFEALVDRVLDLALGE